MKESLADIFLFGDVLLNKKDPERGPRLEPLGDGGFCMQQQHTHTHMHTNEMIRSDVDL